jgi:hypothetical protein
MDDKKYCAVASAATPALIVLLLDVSGAMNAPINTDSPNITTRIQVLSAALKAITIEIVQRSLRGKTLSPRYRIAMLAYSNDVYLVRNIQTIDQLARFPLPHLRTFDQAHTRKAFLEVFKILKQEQAHYPPGSPAPLVCHMTAGEFTPPSENPEDVIEDIKHLGFEDGHALVENVYFSDSQSLSPQATNLWPGFKPGEDPREPYCKRLIEWSSVLPVNYRRTMCDYGLSLQPGSVMMYPGANTEFIRMAFAMSLTS